MLGVDDARFSDKVPRRVGALLQLHHPIVLDHRRAAFLGRASISPDRACGVDVTLAVGPHASEHAVHVDDRATDLDFLGVTRRTSSIPMAWKRRYDDCSHSQRSGADATEMPPVMCMPIDWPDSTSTSFRRSIV